MGKIFCQVQLLLARQRPTQAAHAMKPKRAQRRRPNRGGQRDTMKVWNAGGKKQAQENGTEPKLQPETSIKAPPDGRDHKE